MSQRVAAAAESCRAVAIREYDEERDKAAVEEMEKRCEMGGQRGKPSLVTDLLGDPICRIRHFPSHLMLVAEYYGEEKQIVGVVRGCVKTVTRGKRMYVKVAYILGLRVSPAHRRLGIGTKLVQHLEKWCREQHGVEYAYMATDSSNEASINLFTKKFSYAKFRTPTMLVQPVHAHYKPLSSSKTLILPLPPRLAELVYRRIFANSEFFPKDIDRILTDKLSLGTFMAVPVPKRSGWNSSVINPLNLPPAFAILSVWNTKDVFKLQVKGASALTYAWCAGTRALDARFPWLHLPSIPNVFKQFGVYFVYGLHMEGKQGLGLMRSLCSFVHNMGRDDGGCAAVVAEVGHRDPVKDGIPHWTRFSWAEDLWCIKNFASPDQHQHQHHDDDDDDDDDWIASPPTSPVIFVDPRDF